MNGKRILSWILAGVLAVSMCGTTFAHAEERQQGEETQTGPEEPVSSGDAQPGTGQPDGAVSSGDAQPGTEQPGGVVSPGDAVSSGNAQSGTGQPGGAVSSGDARPGTGQPGEPVSSGDAQPDGRPEADMFTTDERIRTVPMVLPGSDGKIHKFVSEWSYVSAGDAAIHEENYQYDTELNMVIPSDRDKLIKRLEGALPKQILCKGWYNADLGNAGFRPVDSSQVSGRIEGYVDIKWNVAEVVAQTGAVGEGTVLTFDAMPVSNDGYLIRVNTNDPDFRDDGGGDVSKVAEADTAETGGILNLTVTVHELSLEGHTVYSVDPPATRVDLFDYWVDGDGAVEDDILPKSEFHKNVAGTPVERTAMADWNKGINRGRLLLFGDGNIHAGFWNKGAGAGGDYGKKYAGMAGIVKKLLEDGYPVIDTEQMGESIQDHALIDDYMLCGDHIGDPADDRRDSQDLQNISKNVIAEWEKAGNNASLDYLFDPGKENDYKRSYPDVKGLFQLDDYGYYYYDMRRNYAEYDEGNRRFKLYDAPAVDRTDGLYESGGFVQSRRSVGNFFPLNGGDEVFTGVDSAGHLVSDATIQSNNSKGIFPFNHHLGMTVSIDFRQPAGGLIGEGEAGQVPMSFQFSGDDDVWIFIDDVLVLDLGGIHSEIYGAIDFSTGEVVVGQSWKTNGFPYNADGTVNMQKLKTDATIKTTLLDLYSQAGAADQVNWNQKTFASDSNHTLKMFYLERGNYDSSLALRFNLQPRMYQYIEKVDQDGNPIPGIRFDLYPAQQVAGNEDGAIECLYTDSSVNGKRPFYVKQIEGEDVLASLTTGADGMAVFMGAGQEPFNFADLHDYEYFVLKEVNAPDGYRSLPTDIVLRYDQSTAMLTVANRWSTGAYACSIANITGMGRLNYGSFDKASGNITQGSNQVDSDVQETGLTVAIPMLYQQSKNIWVALYGSNLGGFQASQVGAGADTEEWRNAVLTAALEQAAGTDMPQWYLSWDDYNQRLTGTLNDLPGLGSRYQMYNSGGDMRMIYGVVDPKALERLGIREDSARARYEALGRYVRENGAEETLKVIMETETQNTGSGKGFSFLSGSQFIRSFRSLIYIPNEQRELWVMKVDQNGVPRNGAQFGLYRDAQCQQLVASGTTATVDGQDGLLIFSPGQAGNGYAQIAWASSARTHYYLREISAPGGLNLNTTVIPVVVGTYSIYADAGTKEDGVKVLASVGKLVQTMEQYANDSDVDITLRDITIYGQHQPSSNTDVPANAWRDMELETTLSDKVLRSMNLHYRLNAIVDYGLHDVDGGKIYRPFFVTDSGFIRARAEQNYATLTGADTKYETTDTDTNKDDLTGVDITSLFSLLNVVVVEDRANVPPDTGELLIRKDLTGTGLTKADYARDFSFTLKFTDASGRELTGGYYFWGKDKTGIVRSGDTIVLHHDDEITVQGLPVGTRFAVQEKAEAGWYTDPDGGMIEGTIEKGVTAAAEFLNSRQAIPPRPATGSLMISKQVTGSGGDYNEEFSFTITLTDERGTDLTESFAYSGAKSGTVSSGDAITLRHGQSVTVRGLPEGTRYTVTESGGDGYTVTKTGDVGEIQANDVAAAVFVNHKDRPPEESKKPDPPEKTEELPEPEPPDGSDTPEKIVITEGSSPETGDEEMPEVRMLFGAASASLAGVVALYVTGMYQRRQQNKRGWNKKRKNR